MANKKGHRHKGYTIPYFIKFFSDIPASRWCCDALTNSDVRSDSAVEGEYVCDFKACALGYAGAYKVEETKEKDPFNFNRTIRVFTETKATTPGRQAALEEILGGNTASINDNDADLYSRLGKTPRSRILKALRLRQKNGKNWHNKFLNVNDEE